uniref:hypothetical protein n=1 Tax=Amycolatopsis solani TaxID=3028615 RepID=UPI0025B158D3
MRLSKDDFAPAVSVVAVSPLRWPSARGVAAVARGGGLGVLDLTGGDAAGADELALLGEWGVPAFGARGRRPARGGAHRGGQHPQDRQQHRRDEQ